MDREREKEGPVIDDYQLKQNVGMEDSSQEAAEKVTLLVDQPATKKRSVFVTRASWSLVMIFSFLFAIVYLQQPGSVVLVFILQGLMYRELISIGKRPEVESASMTFVLWWWFFVVSCLTYGSFLKPHVLAVHTFHKSPKAVLLFEDRFQLMLISLKKFMFYENGLYLSCFIAYMIGLFIFAANLKKKFLKYHFQRFALSHVVLVLVTAQSSAMGANMFHGMIWFLLPCGLVICNDIWAFIFGFFLGKTPLISISPKKTWEGFLGGFLATLFFGVVMSRFFSMFQLMTCPKHGFRLEYWPTCEIDPVFVTVAHEVPVVGWTFYASPMDKHVIVMVLFASLIAPFGGFFASGFKRAFNIKDFGDSIPGHGGVVDRMDCQVLMGMFVFVYFNAFVLPYRNNFMAQKMNVDKIWKMLNSMDDIEKAAVYRSMGTQLVDEGLI